MSTVPDNSTLYNPALMPVVPQANDAFPLLIGRAPSCPELDSGSTLANEIAVAHAIQQSLLPKEFPVVSGYGLSAFCQSAGGLGGDFYDVISLGRDKILLFVADVMGTGVPAALFAASLRMLVRSSADRAASPSELLTWVNRQMFSELSSVDMFITAQMALLDATQGLLRVASAGHCPFVAADDEGHIQVLAPKGLPLGIQADEDFFEDAMPLSECACALMYTDGLTEASDAQGSLFGQERLEEWLAHTAGKGPSAEELKRDFLSELSFFRGQQPSRDDLTLLVIARELPGGVLPLATGHAEALSPAPFAE